MTRNHVRCVPVSLQGALNGQICREHRRLGVFGLLEFVLCRLQLLFGQGRAQNKSRKGFTSQNLHHRFIGLRPDIGGCRKALGQICRHANVLAALAGIHVNRFGLGRHGWLIGDKDALGLQKAPFFSIQHRFGCEALSFRKFSPGRGDKGHAERCLGLKGGACRLKGFGKSTTERIVVKQRALKRQGGQLLLQTLKRIRREKNHAALHRL